MIYMHMTSFVGGMGGIDLPDHPLAEDGDALPYPGMHIVNERQGRLHGGQVHRVLRFDALTNKNKKRVPTKRERRLVIINHYTRRRHSHRRSATNLNPNPCAVFFE